MADGLQNERLIHLFTTPILKHMWEDSEDLNEDLRRIIINKTRGGKGTTYSAVGGWESGDDFHQWSGDLGQTVVQRVAEMVKQAPSEIYAPLAAAKKARGQLPCGQTLIAAATTTGSTSSPEQRGPAPISSTPAMKKSTRR